MILTLCLLLAKFGGGDSMVKNFNQYDRRGVLNVESLRREVTNMDPNDINNGEKKTRRGEKPNIYDMAI